MRRAKDINRDTAIKRADGLTRYWRLNGWTYGDDHGTPPCCNGKTSCDGLIARMLWDCGLTDQPSQYRVVVSRLGEWLEEHEFEKSTSYKDAKRGSICIVRNSEGSLHTFIISEVKGSNMVRYDCGSDWCIQHEQPFETGFSEYPNLVALYNFPEPNKTEIKKGVVNCKSLHVRKWAGIDVNTHELYETLTSQPVIYEGDSVSILDEIYAMNGDKWYYILTSKNKHGFVNASYINVR